MKFPFWRRAQRNQELLEEMQAHLSLAQHDATESGKTPKEAQAAAHQEFGNVGLAAEVTRDTWGWRWFEDLVADLGFGLRMLRKNPGFTAVGLLTIAIGIGANAAVFSVVNSVLLKPLRYPKSDELVALRQAAPGAAGLANFVDGLLLSPSMYFTYAEQNRTFQSLGVWVAGTANVTGLGRAGTSPHGRCQRRRASGARRSPRSRPLALCGRPDSARSGTRVMLSYGYWQRRFGGDRSAIGRNITVDSRPREIVGVMPEGFRFVDADFDLILPLAFDRGTS